MDSRIIERLSEYVEKSRIKINEPLKKHVTFKVGGPADYYIEVLNEKELLSVIQVLSSENIPYYILGNGSNMLVTDKGYRGAVVTLKGDFLKLEILECTVKCGTGVLLSQLAAAAAKNSLTGFEFASGIPGSLGGALVMNAGAYGGEIKDVLKSVRVMDKEGNIMTLPVEELHLSYRNSIFKQGKLIALEALIELKKGVSADILLKMDELKKQRNEKQPVDKPSAGSTFKRPEGYFAAKLIDDANLRGYQIGGARVSDKHCGFIVNEGGADAADILELIEFVKNKVYSEFKVKLEPEVCILGE